MTAPARKETLNFLDTFVTVHVAAATNADGLSVTEHRVPYGFSPPLHVHRTEDEVFHVLEGEAHFVVDGKYIHVRAGDTLVGPKSVPHSFVVTSPQGARWINVTRGGDFERMVRAVGRPTVREQLPVMVTAPVGPQAAALEAACAAHGIDLIGPPLSLQQVLDHDYV
jgi:mannose-6-phosphate isomerase-like protein (cupin superfamily)